MSISRNAEPGDLTEQQQVQQPTFNFPSAIPIKKRRFPLIQPPSPPLEETTSCTENNESKNVQELKIAYYNESKNVKELKISENNESKDEQESKVTDEDGSFFTGARTAVSPGNSEVCKTSVSTFKKEANSSNFNLGQPNVESFVSKQHEAKYTDNLKFVADLGNKSDLLSNEKSSDPEASDMRSQSANVKQENSSGKNTEDTCALELSKGSMVVELSLGLKEPAVPYMEQEIDEAICNKPDKSDPSLLGLALSNTNLTWLGTIDSTLNAGASEVFTNRSSWDLNTTMDAWEGSTGTDAFTGTPADVCGFIKTNDFQDEKSNDFQDEKSSLTTAGTLGLNLDKGKCILDVCGSNSSNATIQQSRQQCVTGDSLDLGLIMPHRELDVRKEQFSLSDNLSSTSASHIVDLQRVQILATNINRTVKSEPCVEDDKHDCSIGSGSSTTNVVGLLENCVKTEFVNSQPTVSSDSIVYSGKIMKPEVLQQDNQKGCKSDNITLLQSFSRIMQNRENSASSSSPLIPVPLMLQRLSSLSWPACSESMRIGDLSTLSENCREVPPSCPDDKISRSHDIGNLSAVDDEKHKLTWMDEDTFGMEDDDKKLKKTAKTTEERCLVSYCGPQGNCYISNLIAKGENKCSKEDEEYEDGEVREPIQCLNVEKTIASEKKVNNSEYFRRDSQISQPSGNQDVITPSELGSNSSAKDILQETCNDSNVDRISPYSENESVQKTLEEELEVGVDEKRTISGSPVELPEDYPAKEIPIDGPADLECGVSEVVKETCSRDENNNSTLSKAEASLDGHEAAKYSSNAGNKSRIINLSRAAAVSSPCKMRSFSKRLPTTWSGKERHPDLDGEAHLRGNRDEFYTTSRRTNKFAKDRAHDQDQLCMDPRSSFSNRMGKISDGFGSLRGDWDMSDHDFAPEISYDPSDYRPTRRKHASDVEIECNEYDIQQDGTSNRRKPKSDDFPSLRRASLTRLSPRDRENKNFPRFRNMSPNWHCDKFMRHLPDHIINPSYNHPQAMYDELDRQHVVRRSRNYSNVQRKGYSRNRSKSPIRSRTRSPGPWSSPQNSRRSPGFYRTGRMRLPESRCFRDEMVPRRHGSPPYGPRQHHPNNDRRPAGNSNRRGSPERAFPRSSRRMGELDSRDMMGVGCDKYMDGPSYKFHERRRHVRSFRVDYNGDSENFQFHPSGGHRPYRFCSDSDGEFVESGGGGRMRESEFDGRAKHHRQAAGVSRRVRNVKEHEDGSYRPVVDQGWHDDGFSDDRGKRTRF